jgi:hypothetical protein
MGELLYRAERKKTNVVGLAYFFESLAHAHITRQSPAAIGGPFKGGDDYAHRQNSGRPASTRGEARRGWGRGSERLPVDVIWIG